MVLFAVNREWLLAVLLSVEKGISGGSPSNTNVAPRTQQDLYLGPETEFQRAGRQLHSPVITTDTGGCGALFSKEDSLKENHF